jgi:hypothetical protein
LQIAITNIKKMKKKYILTLLMTLCFTVSSFGQELMLNGGLENWTTDIGPTDWTKAEGLVKSTDTNTGSFSAKQTKDDSRGRVNLTQNIPKITVGESYTITFWYKIAVAGKPVKIWCNFRDNTGGFIGGNDPDVLRANLDVNGNAWTKYEVTITAPAKAVKFWFEVRTFSNTTVYWDDFSFFHD